MMRELGLTLETAHLAGWHNVARWVRHLGPGSATWALRHREWDAWASPLGVPAILADIYDAVSGCAAWLEKQARGGGYVSPPRTYPRPSDRKAFGRGAIAIKDFDDWYYGRG